MKIKLSNQIEDEWMNDSLLTYIQRDIVDNINN